MSPLSQFLSSALLSRAEITPSSDLLTPSDVNINSNSAFDNPDQDANPSNDSMQAWIIIVPVLVGLLLIVGITCWVVTRRRQKTRTSLTALGARRQGGGESGDPIWGDDVQLQQRQQQQKDLQYEAPPPAYDYGGSETVGKMGSASHAEHVADHSGGAHGGLSGGQSVGHSHA